MLGLLGIYLIKLEHVGFVFHPAWLRKFRLASAEEPPEDRAIVFEDLATCGCKDEQMYLTVCNDMYKGLGGALELKHFGTTFFSAH